MLQLVAASTAAPAASATAAAPQAAGQAAPGSAASSGAGGKGGAATVDLSCFKAGSGWGWTLEELQQAFEVRNSLAGGCSAADELHAVLPGCVLCCSATQHEL
jgi:hypothetical protein